jgi:CRP-like cAMP-binding protein
MPPPALGPPIRGRTDSPQHNALLRGLPDGEFQRIGPHLTFVELPVTTVLHEPGQTMEHVYFPLEGVLSLLALGNARGAVEVGTIGNEGLFGLPVFHGTHTSPQQCLAQVAGAALRLPARRFTAELPNMPRFSARIHRYAQAFFNDVAQSVACNQLHSLDQRCARWLLMTQDRVQDSEFVLTQRFLALMLGTRCESVSTAARALQKRGCIEYTRGLIEIIDRRKLERASCPCYATTRSAYAAISQA